MLNGSGASRTYAARMDRLIAQLGVVLGAFVAGALLAELFGASSLGVALAFGQIAFALALGFVLLRA